MTRAADLAKLIAGGGSITVDDNASVLSLVSTDADANSGPVQVLYRNSSSPADSDLVGEMHFRGRNDNSQDVEYVTISTRMEDVSDGTEDGKIILKTMVDGTARSRIEIDHTDVVINQDSIDSNFRVESDANAHALFLEGSSGNVGIGVSPTTAYGVVTQIHDTGTDGANLRLTDANSGSGTGNGFEIIQQGSNNFLINRESGYISIYNNGSERLRVLSGGGLTFNGDTATANALNDYEEGTWTAQLTDGSTDVDLTTSAVYTKIGNLVTVSFDKYNVNISSLSSTSDLSIKTLPFPSNATSHGNKIIHITGTSSGSNVPVLLYPVNTATGVALYKAVSSSQNMAALKPSDLASQVSVRLTFTYFTDS